MSIVLCMLETKQIIVFSLASILCTACSDPTLLQTPIDDESFFPAEPFAIEHHLLQDESFEAASRHLEERGMSLSWKHMEIEYSSQQVLVPVANLSSGQVVAEIYYDGSYGDTPVVSIVEYYSDDDSSRFPSVCDLGDWRYMDSCYIAYQTSVNCLGGSKLWRRDRMCRQLYQNGRELSGLLDYVVSCSAMSSSSGCNDVCYDDQITRSGDR